MAPWIELKHMKIVARWIKFQYESILFLSWSAWVQKTISSKIHQLGVENCKGPPFLHFKVQTGWARTVKPSLNPRRPNWIHPIWYLADPAAEPGGREGAGGNKVTYGIQITRLEKLPKELVPNVSRNVCATCVHSLNSTPRATFQILAAFSFVFWHPFCRK